LKVLPDIKIVYKQMWHTSSVIKEKEEEREDLILLHQQICFSTKKKEGLKKP